jgi:predicted ATPase
VATPENWEDAGDEGDEGATAAGAEGILAALRVRGIAVPDEARQRIQTQEDPGKLERWLEKAVIATSVEDVIDDPS